MIEIIIAIAAFGLGFFLRDFTHVCPTPPVDDIGEDVLVTASGPYKCILMRDGQREASITSSRADQTFSRGHGRGSNSTYRLVSADGPTLTYEFEVQSGK